MEFVSKKKKLKVTIDDVAYEVRVPSVDELEAIEEKVKTADPGSVVRLYREFFVTMGLPIEASGQFDIDTMLEFIRFMMNPKKATTSAT